MCYEAVKKNHSDSIMHICVLKLSKKFHSYSIMHICVLNLTKKIHSDSIMHIYVLKMSNKNHSDSIMHICVLKLSKNFRVIQWCIYLFVNTPNFSKYCKYSLFAPDPIFWAIEPILNLNSNISQILLKLNSFLYIWLSFGSGSIAKIPIWASLSNFQIETTKIQKNSFFWMAQTVHPASVWIHCSISLNSRLKTRKVSQILNPNSFSEEIKPKFLENPSFCK